MQYKKQRENFVKETNRKKGSLFDLPSFQFIMNWLKVCFVSSYFCIQIHNYIYSTKKGEGKKGKLSWARFRIQIHFSDRCIMVFIVVNCWLSASNFFLLCSFTTLRSHHVPCSWIMSCVYYPLLKTFPCLPTLCTKKPRLMGIKSPNLFELLFHAWIFILLCFAERVSISIALAHWTLLFALFLFLSTVKLVKVIVKENTI